MAKSSSEHIFIFTELLFYQPGKPAFQARGNHPQPIYAIQIYNLAENKKNQTCQKNLIDSSHEIELFYANNAIRSENFMPKMPLLTRAHPL